MASVTLTFSNTTLTTTTMTISVSGGTYRLGLTLSGVLTFQSFAVTTNTITLNVTPGTALNGSLTVGVAATTAGRPPVISVTNFSMGALAVTWPNAWGSQRQMLVQNIPLPLSGYTG